MSILEEKSFTIWEGRLLKNYKAPVGIEKNGILDEYLFKYYCPYYKIKVVVHCQDGTKIEEIKDVRHDSFIGSKIFEHLKNGVIDSNGRIPLPIAGRLVKLAFPDNATYYIDYDSGKLQDIGMWRFIFEGEYEDITGTLKKFYEFSVPHLIKVGKIIPVNPIQ